MNDDYLPTVQGGELAPYTPAGPLSPSAPPTRGIDYLADYSPPQSAAQHVNQGIDAAAEIFANDMPRLGVPRHLSKAAEQWYRGMATAAVPDEPARHGYDLTGLTFAREDQPYVTAFANHMRQRGADQASVRNMIWWHGELTRRLQAQQQQQQQQQPQGFTDAELDAIDARAEGDREAGLNALRVAWGHEMPARLGLVQRYFKNLPEREREHIFNAILPGGRMAANDPNVIMKFYDEATGGHLPSGGNLQQEISALEARMKNRRSWFKDDAAQARLRRLYQQRDGG